MEQSNTTKQEESLSLIPELKGEIKVVTKKDGSTYAVRRDRRRYFFPQEWRLFIKSFKNRKHKLFFITAIHSGGRIMELLNLRHKNIDINRGTIEFEVVKQRKARKDYNTLGKSRKFFVASEFIDEYKSFIRGKTINTNDFIFLDNSKLPSNYIELSNDQKKKYYNSLEVSYSKMLKRRLRKLGIKDWFNFSPHNLKKTYGMWMKVFNIPEQEMCYRLADDLKTYMTHYGSALIFTDEERRDIQKIFGEVK